MSYVQFNGGPLDEQLHEVPDEAGWPLPSELTLALLSPGATFGVGRYLKTDESQWSDEVADHPNLDRGATYAWQEGAEEADATEAEGTVSEYIRERVAAAERERAETDDTEAWNEATGEGVDLSYSASKQRRIRTLPELERLGEPFDSQLDYPERHTTRGVI